MRGFKRSPEWAKYKNKKRLSRKGLAYAPNPIFARILRNRGKDLLIAPKNFTLVDNPGAVIEYFRSAHENAKAQIHSVMDMTTIEKTDLATISLLISVMMDRRKSARIFKKHMTIQIPPAHTEAGRLFRRAQFHETVTARGIADHTFFLSRRSTKVNTKYIEDILNNAEKFLGEKNPGKLSPLLVEIISNTNNHANPNATEEEDKLPWFLSVLEDKDTGRMIFSVVDLGVGIYESLRIKGLANADNFEDSIRDMYQNSQSKFLRTNIPKGVDSSTGLFYRGKGLQTIYNYAKSANYGKFAIITNKAIVNLKNTNDAKIDSGDSLDGTIYYWEMSSNGKF